jgi:hypothetical protein
LHQGESPAAENHYIRVASHTEVSTPWLSGRLLDAPVAFKRPFRFKVLISLTQRSTSTSTSLEHTSIIHRLKTPTPNHNTLIIMFTMLIQLVLFIATLAGAMPADSSMTLISTQLV